MQQLLGKTRYDQLIVNTVISTSEFELATRQARETGRDLEDVLIDEFGIGVAQIGEALASFRGEIRGLQGRADQADGSAEKSQA